MRRLAAICTLCTLMGACAGESDRDDVASARAALVSPDANERYEAVLRLGMLPLSDDSKRSLVTALRDTDDGVRLLAAIAIVAQSATDSLPTPPPSARPSSTPNPQPASWEKMDATDRLTYVDPWLGGTFLRGLLAAARDDDERVRTLALRAMRNLEGPRDLRTAVGRWQDPPGYVPASSSRSGGLRPCGRIARPAGGAARSRNMTRRPAARWRPKSGLDGRSHFFSFRPSSACVSMLFAVEIETRLHAGADHVR